MIGMAILISLALIVGSFVVTASLIATFYVMLRAPVIGFGVLGFLILLTIGLILNAHGM